MITNHKPIDNGAGAVGAFEQDAPFGTAIANRLVNNTQWLYQNRLATHSKSWDYTIVNDTNLSTFTSAGTPSDVKGYRGYVGGGSLTDDPDTIGVQFSTHPTVPMTIPFGWKTTPGARFININIAMKIENAAGGMAAFVRFSDGSVIPAAPTAPEPNSETFAPPTVATDFFNEDFRTNYTTAYKQVELTSTNGTSGMSYYRLTIDLGTLDENKFYDRSTQVGQIFLCFQSGYDPVGGTEQVNPDVPALSRGNRALITNSDMIKYSGNTNPGKLHKLIKFTHTATAREETWHHVLQMRPSDLTRTPFHADNPVEYILWPALPPDVVPPSLTAGGGSGASDGTGLQLGDSFDIYDLTVFTIVSVSIEESFE